MLYNQSSVKIVVLVRQTCSPSEAPPTQKGFGLRQENRRQLTYSSQQQVELLLRVKGCSTIVVFFVRQICFPSTAPPKRVIQPL